MRIEEEKARVFRLYDAPRLDPILVVMRDVGANCGQLLIECYGDTWSAYWGAMGARGVEDFVLSCSADYVVGKMFGRFHKRTKQAEAYLLRIVGSVQTALRDAHLQHGAPHE